MWSRSLKVKFEKTIAIVGGGISGSLLAVQLRRRGVASRIVVLDPAPQIGLGLAYSTPSMLHLLNVPAGKMSLLPDEPDHFLEWLRSAHDPEATGEQFISRAVFGRYMQSLLQSVENIDHIREAAIDCRPSHGGAVLSLSGGEQLQAEWVVLATGNFLPAPLRGVSRTAEKHGVYCHSAWDRRTYQGIDPNASVLLIGSGLTAVDAWVRLRELGHCGVIRMISRHGALPQPHAPYVPLAGCAIGKPPQTARELLRAMHLEIRSGVPWRAVVDSLRERTNEFWAALPRHEQQRFQRHLQRRWDVVRHRMAPALAERLAGELAAHTVQVARGNVLSVDFATGGAQVTARCPDGETHVWSGARVINCTGPDLKYSRVGSPLLRQMLLRGDVVPGPLGPALWSDEEGALRNQSGEYSKVLFNIGPGRQGVLLESIAIPELRRQAAQLAETLERRVNRAWDFEPTGWERRNTEEIAGSGCADWA